MAVGNLAVGETGELCAGAVLGGRYRLTHRIGEGGMGTVWAAERTDTGEPVALKLMKAARDQVGLRRRFLREARAACSIEHPHVVRVHEVLELPESPAIVMELLEGESLGARLVREAPLGPGEAAEALLPVISAVSCAHRLGIVHRDLKPDNIFLSRKPGSDVVVVKVLDFGIAKITEPGAAAAATAAPTTTGTLLGTPAYMSPEQVFGEKDVDHRTDVWSLGMILYQCLTGVLPSRAENVGQVMKLILTRTDWKIEEVAPDLPSDLVEIVRLTLARDRSQRPTLRQLAAVLRRHAGAEGPPVLEEPRSSGERELVGFAETLVATGPDTLAESTGAPTERVTPLNRSPHARRAAVGLALLAAALAGGYFWLRSTSAAPVETLDGRPAPSSSATPVLAAAATEPNPTAVAARPADPAAPPPAEDGVPSPLRSARKPGSSSPARSPKEPIAAPPAAASASSAPAAPAKSSSSLQQAVVEKPPF